MLEQYQRYFDSEILTLADCENEIISSHAIEVTAERLPYDLRKIFHATARLECLTATALPSIGGWDGLVSDYAVYAVAAQEEGLSAIISIVSNQPVYCDDDYVCHGTIKIILTTAENHKQVQDEEVKNILLEITNTAVASIVTIWNAAINGMDGRAERNFANTVMKRLISTTPGEKDEDIVPTRHLSTLCGIRDAGTYLELQMAKKEVGEILAKHFHSYPIDSYLLTTSLTHEYDDQGGMYKSYSVAIDKVVLRDDASLPDSVRTEGLTADDIKDSIEAELQSGWEYEIRLAFQGSEEADAYKALKVDRQFLGDLLDGEIINGLDIVRRLLTKLEAVS